jgi:hypothetical protein
MADRLNDIEDRVEYLRRLYWDSYTEARPHFERAAAIQKAFECDSEGDEWSTVSEIYFPVLRDAVKGVLPYVIKYLFPSDGFLELIPVDANVPYESVRNIEDFLTDLMLWKMKIKQDGLLTLQDALKYGCGYGIVEKTTITPPAVKDVAALSGGRVVGTTKQMVAGAPKQALRYRYLPYNAVVPTPDGDTPQDVSGVFVLDFEREDSLRSMYEADKALPPELQTLKGNVEEIIQNTRDNNIDGSFAQYWWIAAKIGGDNDIIKKYHDHNEIMRKQPIKDGPVRVPILKCYFKNEHIWLANGDTIIYENKDAFQTLRNPVIKATACPDSGNWFARSDVNASFDVADGIITYKNAMLDIITQWLHPTKVYNKEFLADPSSEPVTGPNETVVLYGTDNVNNAIGYLNPPMMPPIVQNFGAEMQSDLTVATGRSQIMEGRGLGGVTRAGGAAMESLLGNMSARQELIGSILEMGWLEDIAVSVLAYLQEAQEDQLTLTRRDDQKKKFVQMTISSDDLRNVFEAKVVFDAKNESVNDKLLAIQLYQLIIKNNPRFDETAAVEMILGKDVVRRISATPDQIQQNIAMMQQMAQAQAPQGEGSTQLQQGVAGGAAHNKGSA